MSTLRELRSYWYQFRAWFSWRVGTIDRDEYIVRNHGGRVAREDRREARRMGWDDG